MLYKLLSNNKIYNERYGFKSKCTDVSLCCGVLNIKRDVKTELEEEKLELEHNIKNDENKV